MGNPQSSEFSHSPSEFWPKIYMHMIWYWSGYSTIYNQLTYSPIHCGILMESFYLVLLWNSVIIPLLSQKTFLFSPVINESLLATWTCLILKTKNFLIIRIEPMVLPMPLYCHSVTMTYSISRCTPHSHSPVMRKNNFYFVGFNFQLKKELFEVLLV